MVKFLGREESIGFGLQAGTTAVSPQVWTRHMKNGLKPVVNKKNNESAMGRPEKFNDSAVVSRWTEGDVEFKLQDQSIGYALYSFYGGVTTTTNADASTTVKDHTFVATPGAAVKPLTIVAKNPVFDRAYPNAELSDIEVTSESGDWVMVKVGVVAGDKQTVTSTVAYTDENEFTGAHVSAKLAANVAGIGAATALEITKMRITQSRPKTPFVPLGSKTAVGNDSEALEVTGELVLRYKDTDLEDLWYNNTKRALQIKIENNDVTIGTSARPSLTFTAPQVTLDTLERSDDLDSYVEQTITFNAELSQSDGYALTTKLTNTKASYVTV